MHQIKGATIAVKSYSVCWNLETVLKKGNTPGEKNNSNKRPVGTDFGLLQFQVSVPGKGHKDIGTDQQ